MATGPKLAWFPLDFLERLSGPRLVSVPLGFGRRYREGFFAQCSAVATSHSAAHWKATRPHDGGDVET